LVCSDPHCTWTSTLTIATTTTFSSFSPEVGVCIEPEANDWVLPAVLTPVYPKVVQQHARDHEQERQQFEANEEPRQDFRG
jgi:hypothetical protein